MATPEVLVVGAGPSGLMIAILLERLGIATQVIERRDGPQRAPAAHVVNARTFEVCRAAGVDMGAIAAAAKPPEDAGYAYWVTRLGGDVIGRLPFECQGDDQLAFTPTPLRNLSQSRFEPILVDALADAGGGAPQWSTQWESAEQDESGVVSRVRDVASGEERLVPSRFLIAADGAGSRVRKSLGIEMAGPDRLQSFVMVHFRAKLRGLPEVPPGVLFFAVDPIAGGGAFVIHDLDREAVFMHPFDPDAESESDYTTARCEALVRSALAKPDLPLEVTTIGTWTMTAQVAERYRGGRTFLVGDAAHRFPPTGGLGLNTGVQDAHNLAWKLAHVLRDDAPASLLDSYESERRPIAQTNADQSLRNALKMIQVNVALGLTEPGDAAAERMQAVLADPEQRAVAEAAVADQAEHFDMPGLQLGFCYAEGALIRDDEPIPPVAPRTFTPSGRPGSRLPHAWLGPEAERVSLLDRVPQGRFLLIAGPEADAWEAAARSLVEAGGSKVPLEVLRVSDVELHDLPTWLSYAGIERDGALLVRPDQHVAWRARSAASDGARGLADALAVARSGESKDSPND